MRLHKKRSPQRKLIPLFISVLMLFNSTALLMTPISASAESTAAFNIECIGNNEGDWTTSGDLYVDGQLVMTEGGNLATQSISLNGIQDSVDLGMLKADFSCDVTFNGTQGATAENAAQVRIDFIDGSSQQLGSSVVLSSGTAGAGDTLTLAKNQTIPAGARRIIIWLESKDNEGVFDTISFGSASLMIPDDDPPTINASYLTDWTNAVPLGIEISADDTQSGIFAIYDADTAAEISYDGTYTYDVSGNETRSFYSLDHSGRVSRTITVAIDNIDTNPPEQPPEIIISEENWTNQDVAISLGEITPEPGASPETRQYRIDDGSWTAYSAPLVFDTDTDITVYSRTIDEAGNVSADQDSAQVRVDKTLPEIGLTAVPNPAGGAVIQTAISDALSGIAEKKYMDGIHAAADFAESGIVFADADITLTQGGDYTVYARDAGGNESVATINVNTYPNIGVIEDQETNEDTSATVFFSVSDMETETGALSLAYETTGGIIDVTAAGIDAETDTGYITFISGVNLNGTGTITVTVSDGAAPDGLSSSVTFGVTIQPVDDMPEAEDDTLPDIGEDSGYIEIDVLTNDSDLEGTVSIKSFDSVSAHGGNIRLNADGDALEYKPGANYAGPDSFSYRIEDQTGNTSEPATVSFTVRNINDTPVARYDVITVDEDHDITINVLANDSDHDIVVAGDAISIAGCDTIEPAYGTLEIVDNKIVYKPALNYNGEFAFNYTIRDLEGETAWATVFVTVRQINDTPEFNGLSSAYTFDEDTADYIIDFQVYDVETAYDDLMIQVASSNDNVVKNTELVLSGHQDTSPDTQLHIQPQANKNGTTIITFKLSDGNILVTRNVTVTIEAVNDSPVAAEDIFYFNEDENLTFDMDAALNNDRDIDGDALTLSDVDYANVTVGIIEEVSAAEHTYLFKPPADFSGDAVFSYEVSDDNGGTDTGTVILRGVEQNDTPTYVVDSDNKYETDEDTLSGDIVFYVSDQETDGSNLVVTFGSSDEELVGKQGLSFSNVDGTITLNIMPNANAPATETSAVTTITMTVSDQKASTSYPFDFTVNAAPDAPVALEDHVSVVFNSTTILNPLFNDYDNDRDTLTLESFSYTGGGTVTQDGNNLIYQTQTGYKGSDSIDYTISDGTGQTGDGTIYLTVGDTDLPPEIGQIPNTITDEDVPVLDIPFTIVDLDTQDDLLEVTYYSNNSGLIDNDHIEVSRLGGGSYTISLTPIENQYGTADITVSVSDGMTSDSCVFRLTVYPVNDTVVAETDMRSTNEDTPVSFQPLQNDHDVETNNSALKLASFTNTINGRLTVSGTTITYIPNDNYFGDDSFTYVVTDGETTATGTVNLSVSFVNDAPVAWDNWVRVPAYEAGASSNTVNINAAENDYDVDVYDGHNHDAELVANAITKDPAHGTAVVEADGTITYTRTEPGEGILRETDEFDYEVIDPLGATRTATVYIAIDFDDNIWARPVSPTETEDMGPYTIWLDAHVPDDEGSYSITTSEVDKGQITATSVDVAHDRFSVTYEPALNANGTDEFSYTITKDTDETETATSTVSLRINPVNDAPVFLTTQPEVAVDEDESSGMFSVAFTDVDGDIPDDELTFLLYPEYTEGQKQIILPEGITINRTGSTLTFSLLPLPDAFGSVTMHMEVSDNNAVTEQPFTLTVQPINDLPEAPDINAAVNEDSFVDITVVSRNSDIEDGDNLTVTTGTAGKGTVTVNDDNTIHYMPDPNENGYDSFDYTLTDTENGYQTGTVYVTINPVNDAPEICNCSHLNQGLEDEPLVIQFGLSDIDHNVEDLTLSVESDNNALVDRNKIVLPSPQAEMSMTLIPEPDQSGTVLITLTVDDGDKTAEREYEVLFEPVNDFPVATPNSFSISEDQAIDLDVVFDDSDVDDTDLDVIALTDPVHGSVSILANGLIHYTPDADYYGTDSFIYTLSDNSNGTAQALVSISISPENDDPDAVRDSAETTEDQSVEIDVLSNDSDPENDPLTIDPAGFSGGSKAKSITVTEGIVTYVPQDNAYGDDSFVYTVTDGNGGIATATVSVYIDPVIDAPLADFPDDSGPPWVMHEDHPETFIIDFTSVESEFPEVVLVAESSNETILPNIGIAVSKDPRDGMTTRTYIRFTPEKDKSSDQPIKIHCTLTVGEQIFPVDYDLYILPLNDRPTISEVDDLSMDEGKTASGQISASDKETATADLTYRLSENPAEQPEHGIVQVNGDASYTYTPNLNFTGTDSFYVVVDDGFTGGIDLDEPATAKAEVSVTVHNTNDDPAAIDDTAQTDEDTPVDIFVLENDIDADVDYADVTCDELTIVAVGSTTVSGSTAEIDLTGKKIIYTPAPDYNGEDIFYYMIEDKAGEIRPGAWVTVTVNPTDDDPVNGNDTYADSIWEDSLHNYLDVLENDDPDYVYNDETLTLIKIMESDPPEHGTAAVDTINGVIDYIPDENYTGPDAFTYQMQDSRGEIGEFTVEITVLPINDTPLILTELLARTMAEDTTLSIDFEVSDVEDDDNDLIVTAASTNSGLFGPDGLTINNDNGDGTRTLVLKPLENQNGTTTITITVADRDSENQKSSQKTFDLAVTAVNDVPTPPKITLSTDENTPVYIDVLSESDVDSGYEGENLTITQVDAIDAYYGAVSIATDPADGRQKIYVDPDEDWDSETDHTITFSYMVKDDEYAEAVEADIELTIIAVNDEPVITVTEETVFVNEDESSLVYTFNVSDEETDDNALAVTASSSNTAVIRDDGVEILNPDGVPDTERTYQITPRPDKNDNVSGVDITFTVDDGTDTADDTVNVRVMPQNDIPGTQDDPDAVTFGDDSYTIDEDSEDQEFDVLINDDIDLSDPDSHETLTIAGIMTEPVNGSYELIDDKIYYTPAPDFFGTDTIVYVAGDGIDFGQFTVDITVNNVNDMPQIHADFDPISTGEGYDVVGDTTFTVSDVDDEAGALVVSLVSSSNTLVAPLSNFVLTHDGGADWSLDFYTNGKWNGSSDVVIKVEDDEGGASTYSFTTIVASINDPPRAYRISRMIPEDREAYRLDFIDDNSDPDIGIDPDEKVVYSAVTQPTNDDDVIGSVTIIDDGDALLYEPLADFNGVVTFDYTLSDRMGLTATETCVISIFAKEDNPVAGDFVKTAAEDTAYVEIDVLSEAGDVDMSAELNRYPGYEFDGLWVDIDEDDDPEDPDDAFAGIDVGSVQVVNDKVRYYPPADWNGIETFTYNVVDNTGRLGKGTITVTVTPEPDAPTAVTESLEMDEDELSKVFDVLANDTDIDLDDELNTHPDMIAEPDRLVVQSVSQPRNNGTAVGTAQVTDDGDTITVSGIPDNWNGILTFEYTVADIYDNTDTVEITLTVNELNDEPTAVNDSAETTEDVSVFIDVLGNDNDVDTDEDLNNIPEVDPADGSDKESLVIVPGSVSTPAHGTAVIESGQIRYTPNADWNGYDAFTYQMKDREDAADNVLHTATVSVEVTPVSDAPTAVTDEITIDEDDEDAALNVLVNDTDVDGNDSWNTHNDIEAIRTEYGYIEDLVITGAETPQVSGEVVGSVDISGDQKTILYTPDPDWNGIVEFDYDIEDHFGNTATGTVRLTVDYVNDVPEGVNDARDMTEDGVLYIDVLDNDTDIDKCTELNHIAEIDPETGALKETFTLLDEFSSVPDAVVTVDGNQVKFVPDENWNGESAFTYTFRDRWGERASAQVTVYVEAAQDDPVANPDSAVTDEDTPVAIDVIANDTDVDIDPLLNLDEDLPALSADIYEELDIVAGAFGAVTIESGPAFPVAGGVTDDGSIDITGDGIITYTPPQDWVGSVSFTYTIEDKKGNTDDAKVMVLIGASNDPPEPPAFITPTKDNYYKDGQTIPVAWQPGSDVEGDDLSYTLDFYDGGSWTNDAARFTDLLAFSHVLGNTDLHTADAMYRIRAYDGYSYSAYAYSETFIIDNNAPDGVAYTLIKSDGKPYTPGTWTNQSVSASLKGGSDLLDIEYWMGLNYAAKNQYTENETMTLNSTGEYILNFGTKDLLGNYQDINDISIKIDKLAPAAPDVVFDHTYDSYDPVKITFEGYTEDPGGSGNMWIVMPNGQKMRISPAAGTDPADFTAPQYTVGGNGEQTFHIMDLAGNKTAFTVTVDWILKRPSADTDETYDGGDDEEEEEEDQDDGGDTSGLTGALPGTAGPSGSGVDAEKDEPSNDDPDGRTGRMLGFRNIRGGLAATGSSIGLLALLFVLFLAFTNITAKVAVQTGQKIKVRTRKRWILFMPKGKRLIKMRFRIDKKKKIHMVSAEIKKGLAKKLENGDVDIIVNGTSLKRIHVPDHIKEKFVISLRV